MSYTELNNLIKTLDKLLAKDGVFIFEEPYLGSMFEKLLMIKFMTNIFLFSGTSVQKILIYMYGINDMIKQETHGIRELLEEKINLR